MVCSMERWAGKVAVVTGASAGIGAAIAKQLVQHGLKVVGFARRTDRITDLAQSLQKESGKLYACCVDITKEEDIKRGFQWTLDNVGPVSILINNAGVIAKTNLTEGDTELWKKVLDTNVLGLCIATREAIKIMKENNIDGHIVHINSIAGHRVPVFPGMNVYSASKYAVTSLTETLRIELNSINSKIKITSVSPGAVKTEILDAANIAMPAEITSDYPYLQSEDIADGVIYVLSTPPGVQVHELTLKPIGEKF